MLKSSPRFQIPLCVSTKSRIFIFQSPASNLLDMAALRYGGVVLCADTDVCLCVCSAWLVSCRAIAVIAFILQVIGVVLVIILLIWVLCEAMRCCDDEAGWCDRCIIYLTPIFWILAGTLQRGGSVAVLDSGAAAKNCSHPSCLCSSSSEMVPAYGPGR